jgi:putative membrane protein
MRPFVLFLGLSLLAFVWTGPLLDDWQGSFSAHMLAHMTVVAIAAPMIALALPDRSQRMLLSHSRPATPIIASLIELIVVWGWHAPVLRVLVQSSMIATVVEQISFFAAGLFLWLACIGGRQADSSVQRAAGAFALLLTSIHMTLLGALLALSPRPLYGLGDVICFGTTLDARQDQEFGGVLMLAIGAATYLAGGITLLARLLGNTPKKVPG